MTYLSEIERRSRAVWNSLFTVSDDIVSSVLSYVSVPLNGHSKTEDTEKYHVSPTKTDMQTEEDADTSEDTSEDTSAGTLADTRKRSGNPISIYEPRQVDGEDADIFIREDVSAARSVLRGIGRELSHRMADERENAVSAPASEKRNIASTERNDAVPPVIRTEEYSDGAAAALWTRIMRSRDTVRAAERQASDTTGVSNGGRSGVYRAEDWSLSFERDARRYDGGFEVL